LLQEAEQASRSTAHPFVPAVLSLSFTRKPPELSGSGGDSFLDISLIMPTGDPVGRRVDLSRLALQGELRNLYGQLARQEPLGEQDPASPTRRLHDILIAPVSAELEKNGITSLLIVADRGLNRHVDAAQWQALITPMRGAFREHRFEAGLLEAVAAIDGLLRQHHAVDARQPNPDELPNRPLMG
jgi:CHAT domain-containing protein